MIAYTPENVEKARQLAARDARERPLAIDRNDVPWSIEAITLEWLDACMGSGANQPAVTDFQLTPASQGTSVRGHLQLERANGTNNKLFAKTYPGFENRIANIVNGTAQAEGHFCTEIAASLQIESPVGHYFALDEENYRAIVIIDDLCQSKDAQFCDENSSISHSEAEDVVRLLAHLHGPFYGDPALQAKYPWLRRWYDVYTAGGSLRDQHNIAMDEAREVIPPSLHDSGNKIFDACIESLMAHQDTPQTLIHSDVHLRNWYKTGSGRMGLCDWQCCSICDWERDFAYAVSTMLTTEDRRLWERDLLSLYLEEMNRITGQEFDFDAAFTGYRRFLPAAMLMWTPTLCPPDFLPEDMQPRDASMKLIQRISAAMDDLDSLAVFA